MPKVHLEEDLTQDEFAAWLPPRDAVVVLMERNGWERAQSIRALATRLKADIVKCVAEHIVYRASDGNEERRYRRFIPGIHWDRDLTWLVEDDVWETGDYNVDVTGRQPGYAIRILGHMSLFDVRFSPEDVDAMTPGVRATSHLEPPTPSAADRRPLSDSLLQKWATLFSEAYPHGSEAQARASVAGMFADKHVSRERLRRVLPERQRGRPRKNSNLGNSPESDGE